jgi:hypothetical protein
MATDAEIATQVRDAIIVLNHALSIANAAELHVDLDYQPVETVGRRNKRRMYFANIERRVAL